nr:hypothetical protein [Levilactobacillus suantsaii]
MCTKYNIPNVSTIYQWVHQYTSGKQLTTKSVKPVKNGRKTTQLERVEIVQWIIANEMDYSRAMSKYDVSMVKFTRGLVSLSKVDLRLLPIVVVKERLYMTSLQMTRSVTWRSSF